jgi:hypothetical protein
MLKNRYGREIIVPGRHGNLNFGVGSREIAMESCGQEAAP